MVTAIGTGRSHPDRDFLDICTRPPRVHMHAWCIERRRRNSSTKDFKYLANVQQPGHCDFDAYARSQTSRSRLGGDHFQTSCADLSAACYSTLVSIQRGPRKCRELLTAISPGEGGKPPVGWGSSGADGLPSLVTAHGRDAC